MSNSTHVKIGKVWWPRKALEGARFVENNDGVIVPVGLSNGDHPFEGQEADDLRTWLAGEPADAKACEQVETLLSATEDAAKVWDAWMEFCESDEASMDLKTWLDTEYINEEIAAIFRRIHAAYHKNR